MVIKFKRKNKKGIFFTLTSIMLISLFFVSFTLYEDSQNRKAVQKRIATMNSFLSSTEEDISRKVYITSYRTFFLLQKRVTESASYISDFDSLFEEAFFNSTLDGNLESLLQDYNFSSIKSAIESKGSSINVDIELSNPSLSVGQSDPWNIEVSLTLDILMQDKSNLALWNKTTTINSYIPITNFEDPLYFVETNGLVTNQIKKTPYTNFASGSDTSNLTDHVLNSYYKASPKAPSFLDRLKGNIAKENQNGIESLVNLQKISLFVGYSQNKSVVDYIYFNSSYNPSHTNVVGMPYWFRLDSGHLSDYNATAS